MGNIWILTMVISTVNMSDPATRTPACASIVAEYTSKERCLAAREEIFKASTAPVILSVCTQK